VRNLTLRTRVVSALVIIGVAVAALGVAMLALLRIGLVSQIDDELRDAESHAGEDFGDGHLQHVHSHFSEPFEALLTRDGRLVEVSDPSGVALRPEVERRLPDLQTAEVGVPMTLAGTDGRFRVLVSEVERGYLIRALPLSGVGEIVSWLRWVGLAALVAAALVLGAVGWWVVRLGVRPLKDTASSARGLGAGDLSVRLPEPGGSRTEAAELARAFNSMAGSIERAVGRREAAERELRRFIADASHELRTPLTTIRGFNELHRIGAITDAETRADALRRTEQETERMARLIDDMADLALLDQEASLTHEAVDLVALAGDLVTDVRATDPGRMLEVEVPDELIVFADADRLRQAFGNIVRNAIVHTDNSASVVLRIDTDGPDAVVAVADTGSGIEAADVPRLTERFYRADSARRSASGGSGLGLAIAESVIIRHGGTLTIESELGSGTTVTARLPLSMP